jgi:hypothetical protein
VAWVSPFFCGTLAPITLVRDFPPHLERLPFRIIDFLWHSGLDSTK